MSEKKTLSEARKRANKKWNDANLSVKYDRIQIVVPKGRKATVEALAAARGESVNGLVNGLLRDAAGVSVEEWKNATSDREV